MMTENITKIKTSFGNFAVATFPKGEGFKIKKESR